MTRLLPLLLLAACAGTTPAVVCDGVEVSCPPEAFTHPGYTPAGAGLPEYRPTEEREAAPRSPYTRVLPQTPETRQGPGLWAGDQPQAALKTMWSARQPVALGVRLPGGEDRDEPLLMREGVRRCAYEIDSFSRQTFTDHLGRLALDEKICLVAALHLRCAIGQAKDVREAVSKSTLSDSALTAAQLHISKAKERMERVCTRDMFSRVDVFYGAIADHWTKP